MRNILIAGAAAGLILTLGAANAYAVPQNSPYATMVPPGAVDGYASGDGYYQYPAPYEGRSAYVESDDAYADQPDVTYDSDGPYVAPSVGFYVGGGRFYGHGHFHDGHVFRGR